MPRSRRCTRSYLPRHLGTLNGCSAVEHSRKDGSSRLRPRGLGAVEVDHDVTLLLAVAGLVDTDTSEPGFDQTPRPAARLYVKVVEDEA